MKKLIFVDNDSEKVSENYGHFDRVKHFLEKVEILKMFNNEITPIYNFGNLDKEKTYELLFNKDNIICSWSVYSAGFPYSLQQLKNLLSSVGRNEINNQVYIDCSGLIEETVNSHNFKEEKQIFSILNAIETNYILTRDKNNELKRLRIDLKGYFQSYVKLENFDVSLLIH